jgi:hypothetical protein
MRLKRWHLRAWRYGSWNGGREWPVHLQQRTHLVAVDRAGVCHEPTPALQKIGAILPLPHTRKTVVNICELSGGVPKSCFQRQPQCLRRASVLEIEQHLHGCQGARSIAARFQEVGSSNFRADSFCIWQRALPRSRQWRASQGRKPILRGRCD